MVWRCEYLRITCYGHSMLCALLGQRYDAVSICSSHFKFVAVPSFFAGKGFHTVKLRCWGAERENVIIMLATDHCYLLKIFWGKMVFTHDAAVWKINCMHTIFTHDQVMLSRQTDRDCCVERLIVCTRSSHTYTHTHTMKWCSADRLTDCDKCNVWHMKAVPMRGTDKQTDCCRLDSVSLWCGIWRQYQCEAHKCYLQTDWLFAAGVIQLSLCLTYGSSIRARHTIEY